MSDTNTPPATETVVITYKSTESTSPQTFSEVTGYTRANGIITFRGKLGGEATVKLWEITADAVLTVARD